MDKRVELRELREELWVITGSDVRESIWTYGITHDEIFFDYYVYDNEDNAMDEISAIGDLREHFDLDEALESGGFYVEDARTRRARHALINT